ncbi:hypothetical protein GCM10009834_25590 [Streptomonospora arabica]
MFRDRQPSVKGVFRFPVSAGGALVNAVTGGFAAPGARACNARERAEVRPSASGGGGPVRPLGRRRPAARGARAPHRRRTPAQESRKASRRTGSRRTRTPVAW